MRRLGNVSPQQDRAIGFESTETLAPEVGAARR